MEEFSGESPDFPSKSPEFSGQSPLDSESSMPALAPVLKHIVPIVAAVVVGGAGLGYAVHEHHSAQHLATQNAQVTAQLAMTRGELNQLTAKVNELASAEAKPTPAEPSAQSSTAPIVVRRPAAATHRVRRRASAQDLRFKKLQSELDEQGKEIADTRNDLSSARTELGGSIARTHDELVMLEKKGERNFYEFDILKSKEFKREGPVSVRLKKANEKHQYADLMLIVDDRDLTQKHVNLYQPVMYYQPDSPQPIEVVINSITKNHIHGYVSAPKYRQSELAAMSSGNSGSAQSAQDQAASSNSQPQLRKRLTAPDDSGTVNDSDQH